MGQMRLLRKNPTLDTNAYAAGDAFGVKFEIGGFTSTPGGGGQIHSITVTDKAKNNVEFEIWLFDTDIAGTADNAAFAPSDTEVTNTFLCAIPILASDYKNGNVNSVATKSLGFIYQTKDSTSLYAQMVIRGAATFAANDIGLKIGVIWDSI